MDQNGFLEEILGVNLGNGITDFFPHDWSFNSFHEIPILPSPDLPLLESLSETSFECCPFTPQEPYTVVNHGIMQPEIQEIQSYPQLVENSQNPCPMTSDYHNDQSFEETNIGFCKTEAEQSSDCIDQVFNVGFCGIANKIRKSKKLNGQPSKNLMAERRRRKRVNDRLSMLRSIVPKISKMDRTSILGDAIDYMKDLLEKISKLQEEEDDEKHVGQQQVNLIGGPKELKSRDEAFVRNSPKFDVERREKDTKIEMCCALKPGLLLTTLTTLEALGLEIQQCVISSFSDFTLQASCSEDAEERGSFEQIKQALFRNAGYEGRCL